jgi:TM2 domain-containing membrane protein YozV
MSLDSANKKLEDGRIALDKAGDDPDLLGLAFIKIHAALEDACRGWLSIPQVAQQHQLDAQNRSKVSWKEIPELMTRYYQWSDREVEYIRRINLIRNKVAHGEGFRGTRQEVEDYAIWVENCLERNSQPDVEQVTYERRSQQSNEVNRSASERQSQQPNWVRYEVRQPETSPNLALVYGLWALGFVGFCGIHRFYLGKPVSGAIWLVSYGCLFVGQLLDLFLIPSLVKGDTSNFWRGLYNNGIIPRSAIAIAQQITEKLDRLDRTVPQNILGEKRDTNAMNKLLKAARANGNVLSIGQAVMMTELQPTEVEELLNEALRRGLANVGNDPETGAVRYYFDL